MIISLESALKLKEDEPTHYNFKSKVGRVYGQLEVMFYSGRNKQGVVTYICKCSCGNYTSVIGSNLRHNNLKVTSCGCFREYLNKLIPEDVVNNRIKQVIETTEYSVIDPKGGGFDHVWDFNCEVHGKFSTTYGFVVHKGTKCPQCAVKGFKSNLPGYFYLNAVFGGDSLVALKYGITNKDVGKRLKQIQSISVYELDTIISIQFENGIDALNLETQFSRKFGRKFLTKDQMKSGFTETIDPNLLQEALYWLTNKFN